MLRVIRHIVRQCAVVMAVLCLATGAFRFHLHVHDGDGLGGGHQHAHHDQDPVPDLPEDGKGGATGGASGEVHLHSHGAAELLPPVPLIGCIVSAKRVIAQRFSYDALPDTVVREIITPPDKMDISAV